MVIPSRGCLNFLPGLRWCASSGSDVSEHPRNQPEAFLIENNSPEEDEQEHDCDPEPRCCKDRESCATAWAKDAAWRADRFTVSANHSSCIGVPSCKPYSSLSVRAGSVAAEETL